MKSSRIGVLGGTFDPVHLSHLQLAQHAIKEVGLKEILFIPAAQPPHKYRVTTPFLHRLGMVEAMCRNHDNFTCSDIENRLQKPSYTVDTLFALKNELPTGTSLFFIIGMDAFLELMTWKSYRTVLTMAQMVVSPRLGYSPESFNNFLDHLGYKGKHRHWQGEGDTKDITLLSAAPKEICSRKIRKILAEGGDASEFLSPEVANYINENNLYN
ncbi:nicotinate (nicotinamide) nucleotide adenylyltransferase [Desulforhopalus sp. IMCC35007]|uniref:nicotinate (nicotinamide) nucleotide adenylyltransferase n=1 Tax=Desulforhopalus sp. IMCC35007 TaxID=2569543 RepID=UPI00145D584F|nr:nicotinate (nicotinamide) nucleotide adenylyltransferase [Desulforhopalus sp. IMCC35007]